MDLVERAEEGYMTRLVCRVLPGQFASVCLPLSELGTESFELSTEDMTLTLGKVKPSLCIVKEAQSPSLLTVNGVKALG